MCKIREMIRKAKSVLESKVGEGYIDTAVKMIIAVVIRSLCSIKRQIIRYGDVIFTSSISGTTR